MATTKKASFPKFGKVKVITGKQIERAGGLKKWAQKNSYHNTGLNTGEPVPISDAEFLEIVTKAQRNK